MTPKQYCSQVCKARCCKARPPFTQPPQCPMLGEDNLCTIYEKRLGFGFKAVTESGHCHWLTCLPIEEALPYFPEKMRAQCCYAHPELLDEI